MELLPILHKHPGHPSAMEHTEEITTGTHSYNVEVGGTLDGANTRDQIGYSPYNQGFEPNLSGRMENVGSDKIKNPWSVVNGKRDWRSLDQILKGILEKGMSEGSKRYVSVFRGEDVLRFLLEKGPGWISLDQETGLYTATPQNKDVGTHTVTLRVKNANGGTNMQGFDLEVTR